MAAYDDPVGTPTPVKPTHLQVVLDVREADDGTRSYEASYDFVVPDDTGRQIERRKGNLVPHLTAGQQTAAQNFMDALLDLAQGTVNG